METVGPDIPEYAQMSKRILRSPIRKLSGAVLFHDRVSVHQNLSHLHADLRLVSNVLIAQISFLLGVMEILRFVFSMKETHDL